MRARQVVITEPFKVAVREVELPPPGPDQILVETEVSAVSPGTELAVYTGTHQWLKDPNLPDWKFPFRSGYSAAGRIAALGGNIRGWNVGDRVSYPGNHASHELLTLGHERGRWWKLPDGLDAEKASLACIARYGLGASVRAGLTLARSAAVLGLGLIGQFSLRCLIAAGANPVVGIDTVKMRREAALAAGADFAIDPSGGDAAAQLQQFLGARRRDRGRCDGRAGRDPDGDESGVRRRPGGGGRQPARPGEQRQLLRRPAPPLPGGDGGARQHAVRAGTHAACRGMGHPQGAALVAGSADERPAEPERPHHAAHPAGGAGRRL